MQTDVLPELEPLADTSRPPARILIIDDEQDQVEALAIRLRKQGYETLTAGDGRQGLALASQEHPHLIVLDLGLPDSDGLAVCAQLVDAVETCGTPVVIVSGNDSPDIVRRSRAAGGQYFVRKPYDPNVLLTLVERALESPFL